MSGAIGSWSTLLPPCDNLDKCSALLHRQYPVSHLSRARLCSTDLTRLYSTGRPRLFHEDQTRLYSTSRTQKVLQSLNPTDSNSSTGRTRLYWKDWPRLTLYRSNPTLLERLTQTHSIQIEPDLYCTDRSRLILHRSNLAYTTQIEPDLCNRSNRKHAIAQTQSMPYLERNSCYTSNKKRAEAQTRLNQNSSQPFQACWPVVYWPPCWVQLLWAFSCSWENDD